LLNHQGQVRQRVRLANHDNVIPAGARPFQFFNAGVSGRLWSIDLGGDGRDELLALVHRDLLNIPFGGKNRDEYWVRASRAGVEQVLWEWPVPGEPAEILGVQPARAGQPATAIVRAGRTVYGLAGPTGRPCWRCEDPRPSPAHPQSPEVALLSSDDGAGWPRVIFYSFARSGEVTGTVCRPAWPALPTGQYAPSAGAPLTSFGPVAGDPRFARPLPWAAASVQGPWHFLTLAAAALLALWASRARSRHWPVLAGLGFIGLTLFFVPWLMVLVALGAGIYLYCLLTLASGRQWELLIGMLALTLAVTLAVSLAWLFFDSRDVGSFRYTWSGWYGAFLVGVSVTGMWISLVKGFGRIVSAFFARAPSPN
jgi:hypothetical protein